MASPIHNTINGFYQCYLGRDAEPGGLEFWANVYSTQGHAAVETAIANSQEANSDVSRNRVIHRLYNQYLGRSPDSGGLAHWLSVYRSQGRSAVESYIANSDEALVHKYPDNKIDPIITQLYRQHLGRDPEAAGLNLWRTIYRKQGPEAVSSGIANSAEANSDAALVRKYPDNKIDPIITQLYRQHLGRDPEAAGLNHWRTIYRKHGPEAVTSGIANSDEASDVALVRKYPDNEIDPIITQLYRQHLGRDPEPDGLKFWRNIYRKQGPEAVTSGIANSDEALIHKYPDNKIDPLIIQLYRQHLGRDPEVAGLNHWRTIYRKHGPEAVTSAIANSDEARKRRAPPPPSKTPPTPNPSSNDTPPPNPDGSPRWKVVVRDANSVIIRFYDYCQVKINDGLVSATYTAYNGSQYTVRNGQGISLLWQGSWVPLSY